MRLIVVGTGSSGNCLVLDQDGQKLVLDAGIPMTSVIRAVGGLNGIFGCLVTHEHMDHAKAVNGFMRYGIDILATNGTFDALKTNMVRMRRMRIGEMKQAGPYSVLAFPVQHDAAEPCGFLIRHDPTGIKLLYATDTYYLRNTFPGVHFWLIECNYCSELMHEQELDALNLQERQMLNRLRKSHMSLHRLKQTLAANDLTETRKIILLHLSDGRSNEEQMVREVQEQTGIETIAADKGMEIELSLTPF